MSQLRVELQALRPGHRMLEIESCMGHCPLPPHLVVQHWKLRPRGGWVSPGCAVTRMLGSGHWLDAAWWRSKDAPWWMWGAQWDFLLERPGQLPPLPGTTSWDHLLALLPCCQWSPHLCLCHTCPGGGADSLVFLGLPPWAPVYLWGSLGGDSSLFPVAHHPVSLVQGGVLWGGGGVPGSRTPALPVAGWQHPCLGAVAGTRNLQASLAVWSTCGWC